MYVTDHSNYSFHNIETQHTISQRKVNRIISFKHYLPVWNNNCNRFRSKIKTIYFLCWLIINKPQPKLFSGDTFLGPESVPEERSHCKLIRTFFICWCCTRTRYFFLVIEDGHDDENNQAFTGASYKEETWWRRSFKSVLALQLLSVQSSVRALGLCVWKILSPSLQGFWFGLISCFSNFIYCVCVCAFWKYSRIPVTWALCVFKGGKNSSSSICRRLNL